MKLAIKRYQLVAMVVVLFGLGIYAHRRDGIQSFKNPPVPVQKIMRGAPKTMVSKASTPQSGGLDIQNFVISSGGGNSSGGSLSLTGVIGQPVADTSSGGGFVLNSGFLTSSATDVTVTKTNNVGGATTSGNSWTWTLHVAVANDTANFSDGQTILSDNLPNANISYGPVTIANTSGVTGTVSCNIDTNDLSCAAAGAVSIAAGGSFDVQFLATPSSNGTFSNPRAGGGCSVDPDNVVSEADETNNTCSDTVTVSPPATVYTDPAGICSGNTPCFTFIQAAVNAVGSSGTINVGGGSYGEVVNISQPIIVNINGDISILMLFYSQCTINAGSSTISLGVNWTNNGGTFNPGSGTVNFNGGGPQTIGGSDSTIFNNVTINNPSQAVALGIDETINGTLTLTHDLDTASFTLVLPASSTSVGAGDVIGTVRRSGFVTGGSFINVGSPLNQIRISSGPAPSTITLKMAKSAPTDAITGFANSGFPNAVNRTYVITPSTTGFTAVIELHYLPSELNGNTEGPSLGLWRFNSSTGHWENQGEDGFNPTSHFVLKAGVTQFSAWTFNSTVPTAADLEAFTATTAGNGTLLQWQTGFEANNLGFNIYRQSGGERIKINPSLIAGTALMVGGGVRVEAGNGYSWFDDSVDASAGYWLEDVDLNGTSTWHGPYGVTSSSAAGSLRMNSTLLSELNNQANRQNIETTQIGYPSGLSPTSNVSGSIASVTNGRSPSKPAPISAALQKQWSIASQSAVKIAINKTGWYHVNMTDVMAAGFTANPATLQMFVGGVEVPIKVSADSIEFYGAAIDTPTSDTQIYWLTTGMGSGKRISVQSSPGATNNNGPTSFQYTVERKDRTVYFSSLRNGDAENWFGSVIATQPVTNIINVHNMDANAADQAQLEAALQGVTTNNHQVTVMVNGQAIHEVAFEGMDHKVANFSLPAGSLIEGDNQITFSAGSSGDVSIVDYIRVTYAHTYTADDNSLSTTAIGMQPIKVAGFTSDQIMAIDVANPAQPIELVGTIDGAAGNYSISVDGSKRRNLMVFTTDKKLRPLSITPNQPSNLTTNTGGNFVIITQRDLALSVQPFAAFKQAHGYQVAVVDVEDIYDEFSYGVHSPYAVKDFLNWTYLHWQKQPQYVMLAGSGSLDPKNYTGLGNTDLVPVKLIDTSSMETASDDWFVDFNNDNRPQMSIGRLPVRTAADATDLVNKIVSYEQSGKVDSAVLVSDISDNADFNTPNAQLKAIIPSQMNVVNIVRGQQQTDAKTELMDQLTQGGKIVNYEGHGSVNLWRGNLLTTGDMANLTNTKTSPLVVTMTCLNGYFIDPRAASLGEALVKVQGGGAVSVWASSAMTDTGAQSMMNQAFFRQVFSNTDITIGQAIREAKAATLDNDVRRTWILFGDPTMRIK